MKTIARDGKWDLYVSGYTWHAPWHYSSDRRDELNAFAVGGGFGKGLTDEKDNQRLLYGMVFSDSHYKPQYTVGYAWMARWTFGSDFKLGAGYTAGFTSRSDIAGYAPIPLILPLLSAGTDRVQFYMVPIPVSDVLYFFGRVTF
jgi:palmitoyl transferase